MPQPGVLATFQPNLVENIDDLLAFKRWVGERREGPMGLDTESSGLSPHRDKLRLVQFGDMHTGWAVPWELWGGGALEILNSYEGEWVLHNSGFDARFLMVHGEWNPPWHRIHDTMVLAALCDPLRPKGLKSLASRLVDKRADAMQKMLDDGMHKQGWTWGTVPITFGPYWIYGSLDPVLTCHIFDKLYSKVMTTCPDAYGLELATIRVCTAMMLKGLRIDEDYVIIELAKIKEWTTSARSWLKEAHGITSPLSAAQIELALTNLGEPISTEYRTDGGAPSFAKEAMKYYENSSNEAVSRLASYILAVRHAEKMVGSYLTNFLEIATRDSDGDDLVVRPNINTLAARTGRMSITDPALQTLPRDDVFVRGAFIPRTDNVFISCDADQIEARLAAHFSQDEGLIEAFISADRDGTDFFSEVASSIFNEPIVKTDKRRQLTKNVVYGKLYSAGLDTMARTAGVSTSQMRPVKEAFEARFPGLKQLTEQVTSQAMANRIPSMTKTGEDGIALDYPHTRSPLGRPLVADRGREYTQMLNALIQGHAAEVLKQGLVDLDSAGLGDYLLLPIHDEVLLEAPRNEAPQILKIMEDTLTNRDGYRVPLTWSGGIMEERWKKI